MYISICISDIIIIIQLIDELYIRRFLFLSIFERSQNAIIIIFKIYIEIKFVVFIKNKFEKHNVVVEK